MKGTITKEDAKRLHDVFVGSVRKFTDNGRHNYILLSGGIDSVCVLYAIQEIGVPYTVVNFKFPDRESIDTNSVKRLQEKAKFAAEYLELDPYNEEDVREAVRSCRRVFGRIRAVKVETIYAMLQVKKHIPEGVNVLSGFGGDGACAYHRKDALLIARVGEEAEEVLAIRRGDKSKDEIRYVFRDYEYCNPFHEKEITDEICRYTSRAINAGFPKSGLVKMFADQFRRDKSARKPIGFHKASCQVQIFEEMARAKGYKDALALFSAIDKGKEGHNAG